ncbi:hypothetical protein EJ04DRAFT_561644 [Polyplosphaeria fusca]|uniref:Uncharacterized protein n=1 Tax=Polyplosphaeria fusca TaxID=682080 RepID=A0A9P4V6K8_9PLEO|nr:hypothetical protein EJ04DRAFT_561644 [Polyplosphaeria fusca]
MVKVLDNRVVDLDLLPGTEEQRKEAAQARFGLQQSVEPVPTGDPKNQTAAQNAGNAGAAVVGALAGTVKDLGDTTFNTVGTLGEGLAGTVTGLGKGLGSAAMYGGSTLGGAGKSVGRGLGLGGKPEGPDETTAVTEQAADQKKRRKSEHEDNIEALEKFEEKKPIKMEE